MRTPATALGEQKPERQNERVGEVAGVIVVDEGESNE
jgi:hypothetical protein